MLWKARKRLTPTGRLEKQTSAEDIGMSVKCHKQTHALQQFAALLQVIANFCQ